MSDNKNRDIEIQKIVEELKTCDEQDFKFLCRFIPGFLRQEVPR